MKILVTGGAGFIGANLCRHLIDKSHQVRVLDNFSTGKRQYLTGLDLEIFEGDIRSHSIITEAITGVDGVVHLAANVIGTINLLEAARQAEVSRFILASSNAVLGRQSPPATENKALLPISFYGANKLAAEGYCMAYFGSWGLGTIILRFSNVYGPYSDHKESVVAKFFRDAMQWDHLRINGDGLQTRDFIHVNDVCRAILATLESDMGGEVFQIGTGIETTILELAKMVQRITGRERGMLSSPARSDDIRRNYSDISKAKKLLGWKPSIDLARGLAKFFDEMSA